MIMGFVNNMVRKEDIFMNIDNLIRKYKTELGLSYEEALQKAALEVISYYERRI
jgi:hypothetical protein